MKDAPSLIESIRASSRAMVRELGFMNSTLAGTRYSPSAVHALLEIGMQGSMTAAQLVQILGLEKSSVSRMVAKLIETGELIEKVSHDDGRSKQLTLTPQGKQTVAKIHAYGHQRVETAMRHLSTAQQRTVAKGLAAYAQALQKCRAGDSETSQTLIEITSGYRPGLVGRVAEMHADYYSRHHGFGQFFESRVASGVAEFVGRLDRPNNEIWVATENGRTVGSVAIDGEDLGGHQAHLRWFILDDGCRGSGVGRRLLEEAVRFCDRLEFTATRLSTFKGLEAARRLYESFGFALVDEKRGSQWGHVVTEQEFVRTRRG